MPLNQIINPLDTSGLDKEWRPVIKRAIYSSLIASAGSYFLLGEKLESKIFNYPIVSAGAVGFAAGLGSVGGNLLTDYVINQINQSQGLRIAESNIAKYGFSGLSTVGALYLASEVPPSVEGFAVGEILLQPS
jgi:hypothetical protein